MSVKNEYQQHNFLSNTGFGTVSPTEKVDVAGNVNISTGSTYKINGTNVLSGNTLGSGVTSSSLTSVGTLTSLTVSGDATFDTSTLKVDSTNNRVGNNSNDAGLHIIGKLTNDTAANIGILMDARTTANAAVANSKVLQLNNFTTNLITVNANGNVGIGTASPTTPLDVNGAVKSTTTAKAWVNFDGTTVTPTIRADYNVTSVSRLATGQYRINYTTAFANANYAVSGMAQRVFSPGGPGDFKISVLADQSQPSGNMTTKYVDVETGPNSVNLQEDIVIIFNT